MPVVLDFAWAAFGIMLLLLSLFSIGFTRYYQSKRDSELSATIVTMTTLTFVLATAALLPIDVFLVSSTVDSQTGLKKIWADGDTIYWMTFTVQIMYYVLYSSIIGFCFFVIPYAYFYHQEEGPDRRRIAFRYSLFFLTINIILFLFGLFVKPNILPPHIDLEWFINLLTENNGAKATWFVIGCLYLPGMGVFIVYTAPGLSILPFTLIKGKSRLDLEDQEVHHKLALVREHQEEIQHKHSGSDEVLNAHDYRTLENLNDEERLLLRRLNGIELDRADFLQRVIRIFKPFQVIIGLILMTFGLFMVITILISIIDKLLFSVCDSQCGFIISHPQLFNPINFIFIHIQKLFPLDYMIMVGIVIYFFLATMTGIIQIGVRFLWVTLYRIKKRSTAPQGLLFSCILLTFGILAFNYSITSVVAPGYAHFGSQVYCNHTEGGIRDCTTEIDKIFPCDVYAPVEICTPTVSSTLIDRMTLNTPVFGYLFYCAQWAFLVSFTFGFIISLFKSPTYESQDSEEALLDNH